MKRLTTILFALFLTSVTAQTSFSDFYEDNNDKATFSMNLSNPLSSSFLDDDYKDDFKLLIKKSSEFKILIFDNEDNVVAKDFKRFAKKNKLKSLVRVKDKEGKAEIFFIERGNYIREIVVRANSDDDKLVLFGLKTKLTKDELSSIISSSNIKITSD